MRLLCCFLFMVIIAVNSTGQGLVAYYSFDNTPNDVSSNKNHGNIRGNLVPTMDRFGNPCGAYHFDGLSAYIEVPNSASLESLDKTFTIALWYRFDNNRENNWLTAVCKGMSTTEEVNNPQFRLQVQQNLRQQTNTCSPYIPTVSSTISVNTEFTKCDPNLLNHPFPIATWAFYAIVFDGNYISAYMNNTKVFEAPYRRPLSSNKSPLYIGMDEPGSIEYFEGSLDDLYIYNRPLSEAELLKLYQENRKEDWSVEEFEIEFPENIVKNASANNCGAVVSFNPPKVLRSSCGTVTITQKSGLSSGSLFPVGKHLVTFLAESTTGYSQSCGYNIIVKDSTAPVFSLPGDSTLYLRTGEKGIVFSYPQPIVTDNCGVKSFALVDGPASNTYLKPGKHTITYKAIDVNDNVTNKQFTVSIIEQPEIVVTTMIQKKDSILKVIKADTAIRASLQPNADVNIVKVPKTDVPPDLSTRENLELKTLEVASTRLSITLYDNGVFDHDTVSIFLNKDPVLLHHEVSPAGKNFVIEIDPTKDNELSIYAENLGEIPPNTALLVLNDGKNRYEINLLSTLKTNGVIRIRSKK